MLSTSAEDLRTSVNYITRLSYNVKKNECQRLTCLCALPDIRTSSCSSGNISICDTFLLSPMRVTSKEDNDQIKLTPSNSIQQS